mgnify:CR=1 FL=1
MSKNWTRQAILFGLRQAGTTAAAVAQENGLTSTAIYNALERPYPRVHDLIAEAIGIPRETIWPQFYTAAGDRRRLIRKTARAA